MSRKEATIILQLWSAWERRHTEEAPSNARYSDFYFEVIRQDDSVRHINAFEVLDLLVNIERKQTA